MLILGDSLTAETAPIFKPPAGWQLYVLAHTGYAPCDWLTEPKPNFYSAIALHPSVVLIETAGNDVTRCMRGRTAFPAVGSPSFLWRYESALSTIIRVSRQDGARVILLSPPPFLQPHRGAAVRSVLDWAEGKEHVETSFVPRRAVSRHGAFALRLPCLHGETKEEGCHHGEILVRTLDTKYHLHFCPLRARLHVRVHVLGVLERRDSAGRAR